MALWRNWQNAIDSKSIVERRVSSKLTKATNGSVVKLAAHAGLKILCRNAYRFEADQSYKKGKLRELVNDQPAKLR